MATKDQNSRMPILLRGIDRRPQDSVPDGSLSELINLRFLNEALRPVSEKTRLVSPSPQFKVLYKHTINENTYAFWGTLSGNLAYQVYVNDVAVLENLTFKPITGNVIFSGLGNSLIVTDEGAETTSVMLYQSATTTYRLFTKLLPDMPFVQFQSARNTTDDVTKYRYEPHPGVGEWDLLGEQIMTRALDVLTGVTKKGYFSGRYLFRMGWELFDGSVVMHSVPVECYGSIMKVILYIPNNPQFTLTWEGYDIQYLIQMAVADLATLKSQYADIIKSLNIYVTNNPAIEELRWNEISHDYTTWYSMLESPAWGITQDKNLLKDSAVYFEVKKIPLNSLVSDAWTTLSLLDTSEISGNTLMTPGDLSWHTLYGKGLFSYNQRLFLGNIKNTLSPGTLLRNLLLPAQYNVTGTTPYYIGVSFDIDTKEGVKRVFSGWETCYYYRSKEVVGAGDTNADIHSSNTIGKTGKTWTVNQWAGYSVIIYSGTGADQYRQIVSNTATTLTVTPIWTTEPENDSDFAIGEPDYWSFNLKEIIGYPDARAKIATLWHKDSGGTIHSIKTITLEQVFGMNFSFSLPLSSFPKDTMTGYAWVKQAYCDWTILSINEDTVYWDGDRIQTCEFENPWYLPASNSYRTDGIVLGMATNAVPLGASQFGQYPVFVFTTKGIWAMSIGSGEVLIESIKPMSDVICTNKDSILSIDGGVIFMANQGLMILAGNNCTSISDHVIGSHISPLTDILDYEKAINNPNTYQPKTYIDVVDFRAYADGGNIAFVTVILPNNMAQKEIIVSNPDYEFSYVFNLTSKSWFKITQSWDTFVHDYPKTYGTKYIDPTYYLDDLTTEVVDPDQEILIHAETRPIKFGEEMSFKKLLRTILYGWLHPGAEKPFTFFMFGSMNREDWYTQLSSQLITPGEQAVMGRTLFSCRSFIIVLGGYVHEDTYIQGLISDIEKRWNDKLR